MLFDIFSHLVFCFYCSDSSEKINQMTYPHNRNADTSRRNSAHHNKSRTHYNGHGSCNAQLRSHCHGSLFHKAVQMFLIQPGSCKPVVKLSRAFRKAEHSCHIERHCRQNRQNDSQGAQSQTDKSQHNPEDPQRIFPVHPSLTSLLCIPEDRRAAPAEMVFLHFPEKPPAPGCVPHTVSTNFSPSISVTPSVIPYSSRMHSGVIISSGAPSAATCPSFRPIILSE